jgi:hypothetical protein
MPGDRVGLPRRGPQRVGHRAQGLIAGIVPVLVVELLQAVQVDEEHHQPARGAGDAGHVALEGIQGRAAVQQPGEAVVDGTLLQLGPTVLGCAHRGPQTFEGGVQGLPGATGQLGRLGPRRILGQHHHLCLHGRQRGGHLVERHCRIGQLAGA